MIFIIHSTFITSFYNVAQWIYFYEGQKYCFDSILCGIFYRFKNKQTDNDNKYNLHTWILKINANTTKLN